MKRKQRVLVLYGGDAATNPRNELLAWLRRDRMNIDARIVAESVPNTDGAVDDRVDYMMDWAEKAIAIVTPDSRSEYGAPNIMDEIGRWRGKNGKASICVVRQGVQTYSNLAGIVYVSFRERIKEAFDSLRDFLDDNQSNASPRESGETEFVVDSSSQWMLIDNVPLEVTRIDETDDELDVVFTVTDGGAESFLRTLQDHQQVQLAYGNRASPASLTKRRLTHEDSLMARLSFRLRERESSALYDVSVGDLSADDLAEMRAAAILADDPGRPELRRDPMMAMFVGGGQTDVVCPIPEFLQGRPRHRRETWELLRLVLVRKLLIDGGIDQVHTLRLTIAAGRLVRIEFSGSRSSPYGGVVGRPLELDRQLDF